MPRPKCIVNCPVEFISQCRRWYDWRTAGISVYHDSHCRTEPTFTAVPTIFCYVMFSLAGGEKAFVISTVARYGSCTSIHSAYVRPTVFRDRFGLPLSDYSPIWRLAACRTR